MSHQLLVCVAWPYANGYLHIGHAAGSLLPPDIFARYQRMRGRQVLMVSGSDTHGTPVTLRAERDGVTPRDIVNRFHGSDLEALRDLGVSYDLYTETDTENHWDVTQDMFLGLLRNGYLYRDTMVSLHCNTCERFLADRYVEGTCPHCAFPDARGDQCDNCGHTLDATELGSPRCKTCGNTPHPRETEHFFLDLGKLNGPLLEWMSHDKEHWRRNVVNFTMQMLESGDLRGRAITRDITWGIPIPLEGYDSKRIYVWFDAVIGYLSATKEWAKIVGRPEAWREWWEDGESRHYYFMGKDNIVFHTVIWPSMLYGYGGLTLPWDVPANEYLLVQGQQLSKSRNWTIDLPYFLSRYDADSLRYMLISIMPERNDSDFTWEEFVRRNNDELVATYGNLVNRVLTFAARHFEGKVPQAGELDEADRAIIARAQDAFAVVGAEIDACHFRAALFEAMEVAREANRYLDAKAPWFQIKADKQAAATSTYTMIQVISILKTLFQPFLPFSSQALHEMLGFDGDSIGKLEIERQSESTRDHMVLRFHAPEGEGDRWQPAPVPAGQALGTIRPLFRKLEPSIAEEEVAYMLREAEE